ncbi:MAG TPA: M56 family metallopeptidase, partial [Acidobacteriaceae bacterium]|nr:M56 family metallopeptidase [Acidobacteriaceae bacterium]
MTQTWQALGWTLLHFLWQGAALFVVYWVADRLCARRGAGVRYALALTALLAMPAAAIATLAYEEGAATQPAVHTAGRAAGHLTAAQATSGLGSNILSLAPWDAMDAAATTAMPHSVRAVLQGALPWLDAIWLAGVFFFSLRALGGWWLLRRLRLFTLEQAPNTLRLQLDALRRQMGIGRMIDLRLSRRIINPLTAGVLKPWILLPVTALTALSPDQLEVVLAHELAHIRRADYFWNLLQTVVETLFFFHPAVWYVSRRVRQEREFCCDDAVVARCSDPSIYATALVRLEEERNASLRFAMALDGHSRSGLRARILRILGHGEGYEARAVRPVSVMALAVGVLLFVAPLPRVFASFREAPKAAAKVIAPAVQHVKPLLVKALDAEQQNEPAPQSPAPAASRPAAPAPEAQPSEAAPAPAPAPAPEADQAADAQGKTTGHTDYIDRMRAAGYDVDLDKYVAMKVQGITPEYAAQMNKVFNEKLSANKLIGLKV